jgi:hypothetical protein
VAVKIGDEIMEFSGFGEYFINGVNQVELPFGVANRAVTFEKISEIDYNYKVDLGFNSSLNIHTHNDIVSMSIKAGAAEGTAFYDWFETSAGLMGSILTGQSLARDGVTVLDDSAMGDEWQVRDFEPKLFQDPNREPQYPRKCHYPLPNAVQTRRRLGAAVSEEAAIEACAGWETEGARDRCLFDVIKTGDLGMASVGAY